MKRSLHIFLVIGISLVAYSLTSSYLTRHTVQYTLPPSHLTIATRDATTGQPLFIDLKIKSAFPMDTVPKSINRSEKYYVTDLLFHQNPVFMVWIMLVSIMMAVAAGSCIGFIAIVGQLYRKLSGTPVSLIIALFCAIAIVYGLAFSNTKVPGYYYPLDIVKQFNILLSDPTIFKSIEKLTLTLCIPALSLIFLCGILGGKLNIYRGMTETDCRQEAMKFKHLGNALLTALQVLSITVVFSVLTSTTLGRSINATLYVKGFNLYPQEISFVYGLVFSVFLGIIYVPVHLFLQRQYNTLKEEAENVSFAGKTTQKTFMEETFTNKLFESGALDNLKVIFTVMAPLISGIVPGILDGFK